MRTGDLYKLKLLVSPEISPDGMNVLFVLNTVDKKNDDYEDALCLVPISGGKVKLLPTKRPRNQSPSWSPDGKRIAFVSGEAGQKLNELCVLDKESGRIKTLCKMPNTVERPAWSSDGRKILFLSRVRVDKEQINHKSDVKIVKHLWYKFTTTGWFHDTRKHLFVVDSRGGRPKQITTGEFDVASACWMPGRKEVAFSANLTDTTDTSIYKDVWIAEASPAGPSRGKFTRVTTGRWQIDAISAMPDSTILFVGREIPDESLITQKKSNIFAVKLHGGDPVNLTASFDQWVVPFHSVIPGWSERPRFAAHGSEVYFTAFESGSIHVFKVNLDAREVRRVTSGEMTVTAFSVGDDGAIAFVSTDARHAPELWIQDGESQARPLTKLNSTFVTKANLSAPEEFWFTASDGSRIQGWMTRPLRMKEGDKCPALLSIHGGPYSAYTFEMTEVEHEFQVLAEAGFAVFYTNPRGSLGYGEKFTEDISGHWAERDFADMMESVDYVVQNFPFVDAERLGVFGGSYGGYMTNWTIGHTNRFKAALSDRCVSNLYSFAGVFDLAGFPWAPKHDVGRGKDPWDVPELYLEKSPVHHIKNINTPLMLLHSDADWSTTLDNAEQMFVGLKRLNKEAKLVVFPGENHFLSWNGRPSHRAERLQHYLSWFEEHLQP
ncbi:MAG TPA: S9 family peptidase [Nitrososphaerales archaeon]|nr:S9 family peptidase [Nitrososphaerales archaeon]